MAIDHHEIFSVFDQMIKPGPRFLVQGRLMQYDLDSDDADLMARALQHAISRLKLLGLIDGDAAAATAPLTKLIGEAMARGERDEENLILFAMGRFQVQRPPDRTELA